MLATITLSVLSLVISIISIIVTVRQNRKLHNENKEIATTPNIDVELLIDSNIGGQIVKKQYAIDSFNVWESKYTPYYVDNEIKYEDTDFALFTIVVSNCGKAPAYNINIKELNIFNKADRKIYSKSQYVFSSVPANGKKANRIYIKKKPEEVEKVELIISVEDCVGKSILRKYKYEKDGNTAMLRCLGSCNI